MLNFRNLLRRVSPSFHPSPDGISVLALHSLGLDGDAWAAVAGASATCDFYVYDQKGHGACADIAPTSFEDFVVDAKHALDQIDHAQVHLVGHSLGGAVAACLAQEAPDRVASLSLIATPFAGLDAFRQRATAQADGTMAKVTADTLDRWFGDNAAGPEVAFAKAKLNTMTPAGFDACWTALAQFSGYDALPGPFPPAFICSFADDQSTPPANGAKIQQSIATKCPDVRHEVISGAGHMGVLTHAPDVAALLAQHWQRTQAAQLEVAP